MITLAVLISSIAANHCNNIRNDPPIRRPKPQPGLCMRVRLDPRVSVCCGDVIYPVVDGKNTCCGPTPYNPDDECRVCCNNRLHRVRNGLSECCGNRVLYNPRRRDCCFTEETSKYEVVRRGDCN